MSGHLVSWGLHASNADVYTIHDEIQDVMDVCCVGEYTMALTTNGDLYQWGTYIHPSSELEFSLYRRRPTRVPSLKNIKQISGAYGFSTAVDVDGKLYTWGEAYPKNIYGELDDALPETPTYRPLAAPVINVSCGRDHLGVVLNNGYVYTWGQGTDLQLGHGEDRNYIHEPTRVTALENVKQVSCAQKFTAFVTQTGEVFMSGRFSAYEPFTLYRVNLPPVKSVSSGWDGNHIAAILTTQELYTWGDNDAGQLGHGDTEMSNVPIHVDTLINVTQVSCGAYHTAAIRDTGELYTWGRLSPAADDEANWYYRTCTEWSSHVDFLKDRVQKVSCGNGHTAAIVTDRKMVTALGMLRKKPSSFKTTFGALPDDVLENIFQFASKTQLNLLLV